MGDIVDAAATARHLQTHQMLGGGSTASCLRSKTRYQPVFNSVSDDNCITRLHSKTDQHRLRVSFPHGAVMSHPRAVYVGAPPCSCLMQTYRKIRNIWNVKKNVKGVISAASSSSCGQLSFYRAMHCSAKCGLAIACRPSVRLSVRRWRW